MINTYDITHRTLTAAGLAVTRARDLMSALTLLRIDGAAYTANFSDDDTILTIDIQCHLAELGDAAIHLAPIWIKTEGPISRKATLSGGDTAELVFVKYIIELRNE